MVITIINTREDEAALFPNVQDKTVFHQLNEKIHFMQGAKIIITPFTFLAKPKNAKIFFGFFLLSSTVFFFLGGGFTHARMKNTCQVLMFKNILR
jgi:hypothetical protein